MKSRICINKKVFRLINTKNIKQTNLITTDIYRQIVSFRKVALAPGK
jgi:hypothetical protein